MLLNRLEVRNYRSIRDQTGEVAIKFSGFDCLVGRNNAGKSNVLKAIQYLLGEEQSQRELHWNRNEELEIDVRGYFRVSEADFALLEIGNKRDALRGCVLDDETLGICRRSPQSDLQLLRYWPKEERLWRTSFTQFHEDAWEGKGNKADFEVKMRQQFPELVPYLEEGKESNKGSWSDAYEGFVSDRPESVEFALKPGPFPQGISADVKNMLPRLILVPAVKEISDVTKTTRTAELGSLLNELYGEVREELDSAIENATQGVYRKLNIAPDEGGGQVDDRIHGVRAIEEQVSSYLAETFPSVSISLEFPVPESEVMFSNARVWIDEDDSDEPFLVENTGEGVKRILIFSLFRTLADLRSGNLELSQTEDGGREADNEGGGRVERSLLILYEEAELFLHPGLQVILLRTLDALKRGGAQVIFTTHSPFMLELSILDSIGLVSKVAGEGTKISDFMTILNEFEEKDRDTLAQVQNVASYVFADSVVLVEGNSDRIVLSKLAPALAAEWDFDAAGIPILPVLGKRSLPLFYEFLEALGISTYAILDLDCVEETLGRMVKDNGIADVRESLLKRCKSLAEDGSAEETVNRNLVDETVRSYKWQEVFDKLESLLDRLVDGEPAEHEEIGALQRLTDIRHNDAWRGVLSSDHAEVIGLRLKLVEMLLNRGILLLSGDIEDYYPDAAGNKVESALQFDPPNYSVEEMRSLFTVLPSSGREDMILFLETVFGKT